VNHFSCQAVQPSDAPALQLLYASSPRYFRTIAAPIPLLEDVIRELESALQDPRRQLEFVMVAGERIGYLDLKFDYPQMGDLTVNLLLIAEIQQRRGIGALVMRDLERRLAGRVQKILAGVFGENSGAAAFWEGLGYHFSVDARPVLSWYAKKLGTQSVTAQLETLQLETLQLETLQLETPQLETPQLETPQLEAVR
jgi:GNAT superfamily N-acetyltransferase